MCQWGAITVLLGGPWSTSTEDLIGMIQDELNHHLLDSDCQKGCISIANSGFDFFAPVWKEHIRSEFAS